MFRASNQYVKIKELGKTTGAFGQQSSALIEDAISPSKFYVVKICNLNKADWQDDQQQDLKQRLIQQADVMKTMEHPNLVRLFSSFIEQSSLFHMVMEFCDSGTLKDAIRAQREKEEDFPAETICQWTAQLAMALQHLHNKKILHRNIKPDNVFLTSQKRVVKLGHFEITVKPNHTMAPEIWQGTPYNFKSEVWSLGVVVYELMALELPFPNSTNERVLGRLIQNSPIRSLPETFSWELRQFAVAKLLERDPAKRPDMAQVIGDPCIFPTVTAMLVSSPVMSPSADRYNLKNRLQRPRHLSLQILPDNVEEDDWKHSFSFSVHEDDESPVIEEVEEDPDADLGASYWKKWRLQPAASMPFKMRSGVQAILTVPTSNNISEDSPSILIVCKNGEIIAFSPIDNWTRIDWRCQVDREISHAVYDYVTDDVYFVPSDDGGKAEILQANRNRLKTTSVQLGTFIETSTKVKGISLEPKRRLLFACEDKYISLWQISPLNSTQPHLAATIHCIPNPSYVAAFFDDANETASPSVKIAVSRPFANQVIMLRANLDKFNCRLGNGEDADTKIDDIFEGQLIATKREDGPLLLGSVCWPFEVVFDWHGNLLVADSWNKRIQIFNTETLQSVWASNSCTSNAYRLAVIPKHPRTGRPAALVDKGNVTEWYY